MSAEPFSLEGGSAMEQRNSSDKVRNISEARTRAPKPAKVIEVPELYRLPAGDRDRQGCMKARA